MRFLHLTPTEETVCHVVHHRCELAVIRRDVCQGILSSPEPLIMWSSENLGGGLFLWVPKVTIPVFGDLYGSPYGMEKANFLLNLGII